MRQTTGMSHRNVPLTWGVITALVIVLAAADEPPAARRVLAGLLPQIKRTLAPGAAWYRQTPPLERVGWGGLAACIGLSAGIWVGCWTRLRTKRVVPRVFHDRFLPRLKEGKLDRARGIDLCDLNPSPAASVVRVAVERWGRPVADLERGVALAIRIEGARLWRHVATLRRIAALAPLIGLLGSLAALGRVLASAPTGQPGPALAQALGPITTGVALAVIALAAYDGLVIHVEGLVNRLDRLGGETIDLIAMSGDIATSSHAVAGPHRAVSRPQIPQS